MAEADFISVIVAARNDAPTEDQGIESSPAAARFTGALSIATGMRRYPDDALRIRVLKW